MAEGSARKLSDADVKMNGKSFTNDRGETLQRWSLQDMPHEPRAVCILVHGISEHGGAYENVAIEMQKLYKIATHSYSQAGYGESDGMRADILSFQHYVDDLLQFIEIIKQEYPKKPLFIMGHSLGGLVLGHALLQRRDLCDGVIMYAPLIQTNSEFVFSRWITRFCSYYAPWFPVGCFEPNKLTKSEEEILSLKADPLRYQGGLKARWAQNVLMSILQFTQHMSEIHLPMFIAQGAEDRICLPEGAAALHTDIQSKSKTLKIYDGCSHRVHSEPDGKSNTFITDICEWIDFQTEHK